MKYLVSILFLLGSLSVCAGTTYADDNDKPSADDKPTQSSSPSDDTQSGNDPDCD